MFLETFTEKYIFYIGYCFIRHSLNCYFHSWFYCLRFQGMFNVTAVSAEKTWRWGCKTFLREKISRSLQGKKLKIGHLKRSRAWGRGNGQQIVKVWENKSITVNITTVPPLIILLGQHMRRDLFGFKSSQFLSGILTPLLLDIKNIFVNLSL